MTPPEAKGETMTEERLRLLRAFAKADEKHEHLWLRDAVAEIDRLRAENAILSTRLEEAHEVFMRRRRERAAVMAPLAPQRMPHSCGSPACMHWLRPLPQPPKGTSDGE